MIDNQCKVKGCDKPEKRDGLCIKHHMLAERGDPKDPEVQKARAARDGMIKTDDEIIAAAAKRRNKKQCNYPGCEKPAFSRGLCSTHYFWKNAKDEAKRVEWNRYANKLSRYRQRMRSCLLRAFSCLTTNP